MEFQVRHGALISSQMRQTMCLWSILYVPSWKGLEDVPCHRKNTYLHLRTHAIFPSVQLLICLGTSDSRMRHNRVRMMEKANIT